MFFGSQATAFAYVDQGTEAAQEESTTETEEPVVEDTHTEENGDPFSVPGNGEVRDDITDDSSKEFLTIKTKNNNTFYIVIDRAATTNNVYMLSQIDENDLKEFLDKDQQQTLETAPSVVLEDEHTDDTESSMVVEEETQADKPDKTATNSGLFVILFLAVAEIAGYYYFNRDYIGEHWNRKFIRTIQAILNSTKGKVGKGHDFFCKAFGANEEEFFKLLYGETESPSR